jgi:hypothetical protein
MKSNSQGTTLLETLVALVILAGGLVALAQFVAYSSANDLRSRIRIEMAQIADRRLHEIRAKRFSDFGPPVNFPNVISSAPPLPNQVPADTPEIVSLPASGLRYRRWTYIHNPTGGVNPNLREVVIIVQSASQGFAAREIHRISDYRTNTTMGPYYSPNATAP